MSSRARPNLNGSRTERAYRAILQSYDFEDDNEAAIVDLATDLLHLCDEYGIDAEKLHAQAWRHYVNERGNDA